MIEQEHTLSISEVQREITRLPDRFEQEPKAVTVTRYGRPVMAILPFDRYKTLLETVDVLTEKVESLQETLEILHDEELMEAFRRGVQDIAEGNVKSLDDVLKELGWE